MTNEQHLNEEFQKADDLIAKNLIEEAKAVLNNILMEEPGYGKAHNHLGWIYKTKEKDNRTAENHYRMALKTTPEYGPIYTNYGVLLSEEKRFDELLQILNAAEQIPEINKKSLAREWAYYYEDIGEYEKAIEKYKEYAYSLYDNTLLEKTKADIQRCRNKMDIKNF